MSHVTIHCFTDSYAIDELSSLIEEHNISVIERNDHYVKLNNNEETQLFIDTYCNDDNKYVVLNKYSHSMRHHLVVNEEIASKYNEVSGAYGNSADTVASYYQFPTSLVNKNTIAIISLGGNYLLSDCQYYWKNICGYTTYPTISNVLVDQTSMPAFTGSSADMENTLDIQIAGGINPNASIVFYSAPNTLQGFYDAIAKAVSSLPICISISWGLNEKNLLSTPSAMKAFNDLFSVAASKKIAVTVASGDNGSADGIFDGSVHVDFPSSCPFATSCGGTTISGSNETVWSCTPAAPNGTGGGVSAYFTKPSYQNNIVRYPTTYSPPISYLKKNRCVPDVALLGNPNGGWTIYFNNRLYTNSIGGTSCAAPCMAGLISLMGLKYGVSLNTSLYSVYGNATKRAQSFKDIVSGSNNNINGTVNEFNAGAGYDMCSGLGSLYGTGLYNNLKVMETCEDIEEKQIEKPETEKTSYMHYFNPYYWIGK